MRGIILDLRNNPGGLLDQAVGVSNLFLDRGEIVSTRTRNDRNIQRYNAQQGDSIKGKSFIVLINGGSASASEIVAGALQDHQRAVIVGTQSFGKGSVQTVMPLGTNGAISLTTAYYFTPSGNSIQNEGIVPDIVIEQLRLNEPDAERENRTEASLRGSLANPNRNDDTEVSEEENENEALESDVETTPETPVNTDEKSKVKITTAQDDYQLNFAINLIKGMSIARNYQ